MTKKKKKRKEEFYLLFFFLALFGFKEDEHYTHTKKKKWPKRGRGRRQGRKKKKKRDFICIWWTKSCVAFLVAWLTRATIFVNYYRSFFSSCVSCPQEKIVFAATIMRQSALFLLFFFLSFLSALHCFTFRHADRKLMSGDLAWWSRSSGQKSLTSEKKKKLLLIFNRVWNHIKFTDKIEET